jgi:hypothetical protein
MQLRRQDKENDLGAFRFGQPGRETSRWYLTARRGLGPVFTEYIFRSGAKADAVVCEPEKESPFGVDAPFWLFRLTDPPARMLGLLRGTPGLRLYRPVLDNVGVAHGYAHPLHLDGCRAALPRDQLILFRPPPENAVVTGILPHFVSVADLVRIAAPATDDAAAVPVSARAGDGIDVPLRLRPSAAGVSRAVGTFIPWSQAAWLRRLCYALPATALRGYRVALLKAGILVVAPDWLEGIPFGQLLEQAAPGVLIPVGSRFQPAVSPDLIRERLGAKASSVWVFPSLGGPPFWVAESRFESLERRVLAHVVSPGGSQAAVVLGPPPAPESEAPEVENDPLGLLPVWGLGK